MVTLTAKSIENLRPATTRREIPDDGARGLYCIVQPSGRKSFAVRYRFAGQPKKLTLPAGLTLAAARVAAAAALHEVEKGNDPGAANYAARKAREAAGKDTFRAVVGNYFKREGKTLRSREWQTRLLERLVYPEFGDLPVNAIKRRAIIELLDQIEDSSGEFDGAHGASRHPPDPRMACDQGRRTPVRSSKAWAGSSRKSEPAGAC